MDQETVRITALQAIFDMLHFYGVEAFDIGPKDIASAVPLSDPQQIFDNSNSSADDFEDLKLSRIKTPVKSSNAGEGTLSLLTRLLDDDVSLVYTPLSVRQQ